MIPLLRAAVRTPFPLAFVVLALVGLLKVSAAEGSVQKHSENPAATAPAAGENFTIPGLGLDLIWVKPGRFTMGSPSEEPNRHKAEGRATEVTLTAGFWLGKTEVTQAQYEAIVGANPSTFKSAGKDAPVECVSWLDATAYCRALTERERAAGRLPEGFAYTLPTEAQWEYACRAGTRTAYPGEPDAMAWHAGNSGESTHLVATKQPNAWGFFDMSGNVLEWCRDWHAETYPPGPLVDPAGPRRGHYRTARGGSWRNGVEIGRSAVRAGGSPGRRDYTLGFRVALTAAKVSPR